jgi:nucleotide-binding universal stress UspA family protein
MNAERTARRPQMDADPTRRRPPVVVGVDGSTGNEGAVEWAAAEAERTIRPLRLVTITGVFTEPVARVARGLVEGFDYGDGYSEMLTRVASAVRLRHPGLHVVPWIQSGDPVGVLSDMSREGSLVVVGKRGLGGFQRILIGSTSIAVVGRAVAPAVVVPDSWPVGDTSMPIVVGIDGDHANDAALAFGFAEADERGVPLIALHGWRAHPVWLSDDNRSRRVLDATHMLEQRVACWRHRFPDVEAHSSLVEGHPAEALLDASARAQLLVLGRTSANSRLTGLPIGSVARDVLHYSEIPVAVVASS